MSWVRPVFRSYFSQRTLDGRRHLRPPILGPGPAHPGDIVGRYHAALAAGDTEAVVSTFAPDGYYREPIGPNNTHRGTNELRAFFRVYLRAGGLGLEHCAVTDDVVRCALEYNCIRWAAMTCHPRPESPSTNAARTDCWPRPASTTTSIHQFRTPESLASRAYDSF
jgi:hypothetical protein